MLQEDVQPLQTMLKQNEGNEAYMYLDSGTPAQVTVGVGHLIPGVAAAQGLPFRLAATGAEAEPQDIEHGFLNLQAQARVPSGAVRKYFAIFMAGDDIDNLLMADLRGTDNYLHSVFPIFDHYPQPAREALYDLAFNVGSLSKWPRLRAAVLTENWTVAANECRREGIGEMRNIETKNRFLSALEPPTVSV